MSNPVTNLLASLFRKKVPAEAPEPLVAPGESHTAELAQMLDLYLARPELYAKISAETTPMNPQTFAKLAMTAALEDQLKTAAARAAKANLLAHAVRKVAAAGFGATNLQGTSPDFIQAMQNKGPPAVVSKPPKAPAMAGAKTPAAKPMSGSVPSQAPAQSGMPANR
jgi:hypothetical protein